jgi:uncharacterized membrane protein YtjA (UPF0391 family)
MNTDKFTRWQQRTIEHLGFSINLILTLSLGALGYTLNSYNKTSTQCLAKCLFVLGVVLLLLSVMFGIIASLTRLYDFRYTARINREEEVERYRLRRITDRLGVCTWLLLWFEIITFFLGVGAIVFLTMLNKLG